MSILIKSMEMPIDNPIRIILHPNGQAIKANAVDYEEYEAVALPPHGRLIDADALKSYMEECKGENAMDIYATGYARSFIDNAQTVIPADKDGEA